MDSLPGYELIRVIGQGGAGTVYEAVQRSLHRRVALKRLRPSVLESDELRQRFLREARVQAGLSHPNLVPVYDAQVSGDELFIVTELVDGGTLRDRLEREPALGLAETARIGQAIALALAHAHDQGILHRDLKPANVMLTREGRVKVTDFGLARPAEESDSGLTVAGTIMGTIGYMGPELLAGGTYTAAVDIYALGIILFEMAAGRRPFVAEIPLGVLAQQRNAVAPPLSEFCPGAPADLVALVAECLDRDPRRRPPSAEQAANRLMQIVEREGGEAVELSSIEREGLNGTGQALAAVPSRSAPRRSLGIAVTVLVACAVLYLTGALEPAAEATTAPTGDSMAPEGPEGLSAPSSPVKFPEVAVFAGHDRVRLELAGPAPSSFHVSVIADGGSETAERRLGRGTRFVEVTGLDPGRLHQVEIAAAATGESTASGRFRSYWTGELATLVLQRPSLAVCLEIRDVEGASLWAEGDHVAACWRTETGGAIVFRESRDGGSTWGPPVDLSASATEPSMPDVAIEGGRALVAWVDRDEERPELRLHVRHPNADWSPAIREPAGRHGPAFSRRPGGGLDLWSWAVEEAGGVPRLVRRPLEGGVPGAPVGLPFALPHERALERCWQLFHTGSSLAAATFFEWKKDVKKLQCCFRPIFGSDAEWSRPAPLLDGATGRPGTVSLAGIGARVVAACESQRDIVVRVSQDEGRNFSPKWVLERATDSGTTSAVDLTVRGDAFFLVSMARDMTRGEPSRLEVRRSRDGRQWNLVLTHRLPFLDGNTRIRTAATPSGLLALVTDDDDGAWALPIPARLLEGPATR